jgi:hypothetical protein
VSTSVHFQLFSGFQLTLYTLQSSLDYSSDGMCSGWPSGVFSSGIREGVASTAKRLHATRFESTTLSCDGAKSTARGSAVPVFQLQDHTRGADAECDETAGVGVISCMLCGWVLSGDCASWHLL